MRRLELAAAQRRVTGPAPRRKPVAERGRPGDAAERRRGPSSAAIAVPDHGRELHGTRPHRQLREPRTPHARGARPLAQCEVGADALGPLGVGTRQMPRKQHAACRRPVHRAGGASQRPKAPRPRPVVQSADGRPRGRTPALRDRRRQFQLRLQRRRERTLERPALRLEVRHDHAVYTVRRGGHTFSQPRQHGRPFGVRVGGAVNPASVRLPRQPERARPGDRAALSAANRESWAGVRRRNPASRIGGPSAGNAAASTRRRARSPASQAPRSRSSASIDRAQREERLLVPRERPARDVLEVPAVGAKRQPARASPGTEIGGIQQAGSIARDLRPPEPTQRDRRQDARQFRPLDGGAAAIAARAMRRAARPARSARRGGRQSAWARSCRRRRIRAWRRSAARTRPPAARCAMQR